MTHPWLAERRDAIMSQFEFTDAQKIEYFSGSRLPEYVAAREAMATLLYLHRGPGKMAASWPEIARAMGKTNHSSVISQNRNYDKFVAGVRATSEAGRKLDAAREAVYRRVGL